MSHLVLINITGEDKPGLTAAVTKLLGEFAVDVLDLGQAVIHDYLTLGILARVPDASDEPFRPRLLAVASDLGVSVRYTPVSRDSYEQWVQREGRPRFILTLLARTIRADHLAAVSAIIYRHQLNIDNITRLSGRVPLTGSGSQACAEFSLRGDPGPTFRQELLAAAAAQDFDVAVQADTIFRRNRRLIAFDMDSTLIDTEVIDELARSAGVGDEVADVTRRAMAGELDFKQSLRQRVALLDGLPESAMQEIAARLPLMEGARYLFETLHLLGYKTAVLSGGFTYFGRVLQQALGIDYLHANELEIENGRLTGKVREPIVDGERKAALLEEIARREGISLEQTIAVGDGANDLPMLGRAGLGIAFHAKPIVRANAEQSISTLGLDSILYLMGLRDREHRAPR